MRSKLILRYVSGYPLEWIIQALSLDLGVKIRRTINLHFRECFLKEITMGILLSSAIAFNQ